MYEVTWPAGRVMRVLNCNSETKQRNFHTRACIQAVRFPILYTVFDIFYASTTLDLTHVLVSQLEERFEIRRQFLKDVQSARLEMSTFILS